MCGAWSFFGTSWSLPVTGESEWKGLSGLSSDVFRTPRLVAWLALMREVGVLAKGKGRNQSYLAGVRRETPRFVAWWFACLLDDERSKVEESNLSGGCACVRAPAFVAWSSSVRSVG